MASVRFTHALIVMLSITGLAFANRGRTPMKKCSPDTGCKGTLKRAILARVDTRGMPVTQSTTTWNGAASRAIDGFADGRWDAGSCTHTSDRGNNYWQLDFKKSIRVRKVVIYNRIDGKFNRRIKGLNVYVSSSATGAGKRLCGKVNVDSAGIVLDCDLIGRYLRMEKPEIITLCEVVVYAPAPPAGTTPTGQVISSTRLKQLEVKCDADSLCRAQKNTKMIKMAATGVIKAGELVATIAEKAARGVGMFMQKLALITSKLAPFLKAIGPVASMLLSIFGRSREYMLLEQLMEEVKMQFGRVNLRFDKLFDNLDKMQDSIENEMLRIHYKQSKDKISECTDTMEGVYDPNKAVAEGKIYELKQKTLLAGSIHQLVQAILDRDENLFDVILKYEDWNRAKVHTRLLENYNIITKGYKVYLTQIEFKSKDIPALNEEYRKSKADEAEKELKEVLEKIKYLDNKYFIENWETKWSRDAKESVQIGKSNQEMSDRVFKFLSGKYDWEDWVVMVYDGKEDTALDDHYLDRSCKDALYEFNWDINGAKKNVLIMHVPAQKVKASAAVVESAMLKANTYGKAHETFKALSGKLPRKCQEYILVAAIRSKLNAHVNCSPGRCVYARQYDMDMIVAA